MELSMVERKTPTATIRKTDHLLERRKGVIIQSLKVEYSEPGVRVPSPGK